VKPRSTRRDRWAPAALIALFLTAAIVLAACGSSSSSSSSGSTESGSETSAEAGSETSGESESGGGTEGLKVGYFTTGTSNAYLIAAKEAGEKKAAEYGMDMTFLESNFEPQEQVKQMELALQRHSFEYWILALDSGEEECAAVKHAMSEVPTYLLVTKVCGTNGEEYGALGFVGVQTPEAYEEWFENMLSTNEPQELALLTGPAEVDITGYAEEALEKETEKYPGFDVVGVQNTDYTAGNAFQVTQDILQAHPNIGMIASNYSGMTGGVVQAVKAAGKTGEVKVYDLLGEKIVKKDIENGSVAMTLPGLPASEAAYSVESVKKAAEGEPVEKTYNPEAGVKIKGGPFVTKANVAEFEPEY
jgi:ribose transport system substrate-binding protein